MRLIPRKLFLTRGVGVHREKLTSFEMAFARSKHCSFQLGTCLVHLPAALPNCYQGRGYPCCKRARLYLLSWPRCPPSPGRRIASSIGVARPADIDKYGYLSEHHTYGQTEQEAGDYAEDLAATMLATTLGIQFDAEKDCDKRREQYSWAAKLSIPPALRWQ